MKKYLFTVLLLAAASLSIGQSVRVSGYLFDTETNLPLESANVYLAQTTMGSGSRPDGGFSFNAKSGKYQLVISHIGYQQVLKTVWLKRDTTINIAMQPEVRTLDELTIKENPQNWEDNYAAFLRFFIGITENADMVTIENPKEALYLYFDAEERALYASARDELKVKNMALGYQIYYDLKNFKMDYRTGYLKFYGIPRFEELTPRSKRQQKRWQKNRKKAYQGSLQHFFTSLRRDSLKAKQFEVVEVIRTPLNRNKALINDKIKYFREKIMLENDGRLVLGKGRPLSDSLSYWINLKNTPDYTDSLGTPLYARDSLMSDSNTICCKPILRLEYLGEPESRNFIRDRRKEDQGLNSQFSRLYFLQGQLSVFENGYYDVDGLVLDGYLSWSEKLAEMLPLDYVP
ncbi:MAG: carboxypeptidase-like regulatory domain-containing protein [Bacteroidota bacterium]